jgi:hypothetical protein
MRLTTRRSVSSTTCGEALEEEEAVEEEEA